MTRGIDHVLRRLGRRPADRAVNDYATHVPVLVGLASQYVVRRVLELGSGRFSTCALLNRDAFPDLEQLDSVEDDASWAHEVERLAGRDARLNLQLVDGPVSRGIAGFAIDAYDMVLVDDSTNWEERVRTIRTVAGCAGRSALILIHDYEFPAYRQAASGFEASYAFRALTPQTGALWNGEVARKSCMALIERQITTHTPGLDPSDVMGWTKVFGRADALHWDRIGS